MLKHNGCKCSNAYGPVCALVDVSDPAYVVASVQSTGESRAMCDLEDQGEIKIDGKRSVPVNDLKAKFQFTEVGWELDNFHDAMVTELDDGDMLRCPIYSTQNSFLSMRMVGQNLAVNISSMSTMTKLD